MPVHIYDSLQAAGLIDAIAAGQVGVVPTDTVYGVVCDASQPDAAARLYASKSREHKPGTVIAASAAQLVSLGLKARYLKSFEQYWPGALSAIIPCGPELTYLHQGKYGLAVRVVADPAVAALLQQTGPMLTSSANQPGEPPATTLAEARTYFGDTVDYYVEGGDLSGREPSTVIRLIDDAIEVLREGAVKISASA